MTRKRRKTKTNPKWAGVKRPTIPPIPPDWLGPPPLSTNGLRPRLLTRQGRSRWLSLPAPFLPPQVPRNQVSSRETGGEDPAGEEGYFLVEAILKHKYNKTYLFLTKWQNFCVGEATWEPLKNFVQPDGRLNEVFREYCQANRLEKAFRQALNLASRQLSREG